MKSLEIEEVSETPQVRCYSKPGIGAEGCFACLVVLVAVEKVELEKRGIDRAVEHIDGELQKEHMSQVD